MLRPLRSCVHDTRIPRSAGRTVCIEVSHRFAATGQLSAGTTCGNADPNVVLPVAIRRGTRHSAEVALLGVLGRPYLDLTTFLDLDALDAVHEEICMALAQLPTHYTGGSHRSMGIVPEGRASDVGADYGEVIRTLDDAGFARLASLADDPEGFARASRKRAQFGEERAHPLSRAQMLWLEARHSVYFPWKSYLELMPVERWEDKDELGKPWSREALTFLPRTVAFLSALPLQGIGRANVMGLKSFDHGTMHHDGPRDGSAPPAEFMMFCPAGNKELVLYDEADGTETVVKGRAFWFNDADFHGVRAAPHFRYSLRVDGPFRDDFRQALARAEAS